MEKDLKNQPLVIPDFELIIQNVTCKFRVGCELDLTQLAFTCPNTVYLGEKAIIKARDPYTTAIVFRSGRITCTGATNPDEAKIVARRYARLLQNVGYCVDFNKFRIVDVLATCNMPFGIHVAMLCRSFENGTGYYIPRNALATLKLRNPEADVKIYETGCVSVKTSTIPDIHTVLKMLYPILLKFRRNELE